MSGIGGDGEAGEGRGLMGFGCAGSSSNWDWPSCCSISSSLYWPYGLAIVLSCLLVLPLCCFTFRPNRSSGPNPRWYRAYTSFSIYLMMTQSRLSGLAT